MNLPALGLTLNNKEHSQYLKKYCDPTTNQTEHILAKKYSITADVHGNSNIRKAFTPSFKMTAGKTLVMYEIDGGKTAKIHNVKETRKNPGLKLISPLKNTEQQPSKNEELPHSLFSSVDRDDNEDGKRTPTTVSSFEMLSSSAPSQTPSRSGRSSPKDDDTPDQELKTLMAEAAEDEGEPKRSAKNLAPGIHNNKLDEGVKTAVAEDTDVSRMRDELRNQIKLNQEMKNLLVASLGGTLVPKLERLIEEKCKAESDSQSVKDSLSRHSDLMDDFGALCQSYQTKYLAARMMSKNMCTTKTELSLIHSKLCTLIEKGLEEKRIVNDNMLKTLGYLSSLLPPDSPVSDSDIGTPTRTPYDLINLSSKLVKISRALLSTYSGIHGARIDAPTFVKESYQNHSSDKEVTELLSEIKNLIESDQPTTTLAHVKSSTDTLVQPVGQNKLGGTVTTQISKRTLIGQVKVI